MKNPVAKLGNRVVKLGICVA